MPFQTTPPSGDGKQTMEVRQNQGFSNLSPRTERLTLRACHLSSRDLHLCGQMYKRSKCAEYIDNRELPVRQFDKIVLRVPDVVLTKTFNSSIYKGASMWNALPLNVQASKTYKEFEYRYKQNGCVHPP